MRRHTMTLAGLILLVSSGDAIAHSGHSNRAPWEACSELALDATCSWTHGDDLYAGTCRNIGGGLMCVRNKPIRSLSEPEATPRASLEPSLNEGTRWTLLSWVPGVGAIAGLSLAYLMSMTRDV